MTDSDNLLENILQDIEKTSDLQSLEQLRISSLGKKGSISSLMRGIGSLSVDERKEMGAKLNILKAKVTKAISDKKEVVEAEILNQKLLIEKVDITLPVRKTPLEIGKIHPISQVLDELIAIFSDMGFSVAEGPDIEDDYHNFTALNFSESHPARHMMDTFYIKEQDEEKRLHQEKMGLNPAKLLRTHTSPVQIRTMLQSKPPIRIIVPGRTFRCDSDQTHTPMFHQVEGLVIDKETNLCNLRWVLEEFCKAFFEVKNIKMRFRPSYFPFTEPSAEVDIGYEKVGNDIHIGDGDKWLEILGSGMVHPQVLRNVGLDPDVYQGFAFGMGIDRIAMLKYGMSDLRSFFDADLRWLRHYGFSILDIPNLAGGLS